MQATNSVVSDVWACVSKHTDGNLAMQPTAVFRSRSLVTFELLSELMSMLTPQSIKVSVLKVLEQNDFSEYYCVCANVSSTEERLMFHLRHNHIAIYKVLMHLMQTFVPV